VVDGGRAAFGRTCRCQQDGDLDCGGEHGREQDRRLAHRIYDRSRRLGRPRLTSQRSPNLGAMTHEEVKAAHRTQGSVVPRRHLLKLSWRRHSTAVGRAVPCPWHQHADHSALGHLTPEDRLNALQPLITLLAEQIVRDVLDEEASSLAEPRKLHAPTHRPELTMAPTHSKTRKRTKRSINPWTAADLKVLRKQAGRTSAAKIAKAMKRTEGAVRQKAGSLGISLRLR